MDYHKAQVSDFYVFMPLVPAGPSTANSVGPSQLTIKTYLKPDAICRLRPDVKLVLDMSPLLQKHVSVYMTAEVMCRVIDAAKTVNAFLIDTAKHQCRSLLKSCLNTNHEELFRKMNTGQEGALSRWQQYSMQCLDLAALQHIIHNKPLPIQLDDEIMLPKSAKSKARDR
jgi:hypothetical protein